MKADDSADIDVTEIVVKAMTLGFGVGVFRSLSNQDKNR
jgi:hypothetical protein